MTAQTFQQPVTNKAISLHQINRINYYEKIRKIRENKIDSSTKD
jgi:hypothetical protein